MQPGDWVMAIGNPFGLAHTVSVGVISATARSFPIAEQRFADVLQTDAAINPGQLRRSAAERARRSRRHQHRDLHGLAPAGQHRHRLRDPDQQRARADSAAADRQGPRGVIGVSVTPVPADALAEFGLKERRGALVGTVAQGGPAAKAGIEPGDIILEFNGKAVKNRDELVATVVATKPGIDGAGEDPARQAGEDRVADR